MNYGEFMAARTLLNAMAPAMTNERIAAAMEDAQMEASLKALRGRKQ